jgi:hypothetical protein
MNHDEEAVLVCAPADSPWTVAGATFDRVCSECSGHVMIWPTSAEIFREFPDVKIVCATCFLEHPRPPRELVGRLLGSFPDMKFREPTEAQLSELRTMVPNLRRRRN